MNLRRAIYALSSLLLVACSGGGTGNIGRDKAAIVPTSCYVGGCSSELCTEEPDAASACIWTGSYACYAEATCERQADGACGWTQSPALALCLGAGSCLPVVCDRDCEHGFSTDDHGCEVCDCAPPLRRTVAAGPPA